MFDVLFGVFVCFVDGCVMLYDFELIGDCWDFVEWLCMMFDVVGLYDVYVDMFVYVLSGG